MGILIKSNFSGMKHACKQRIRSRRNGEVGILISYKISPKVVASPCPNTLEMFANRSHPWNSMHKKLFY